MYTLSRPNILLIYTDQQRWDSLRCYGNKHAITPNIDRLAEKGVRFDRYFVQSPVCMPSRMSFLTGRYCSSIGIGANGSPLPEDTLSIIRTVKPYGYKTAQIGKLHFQPHAHRDHRDPYPDYGFDNAVISDDAACYEDAYLKWVECLDPCMVDKVACSLSPGALKYKHKIFSGLPRDTHQPYVFQGAQEYTQASFVTSEICRYLSENKQSRFFAIAGFYAPHPPVNPPKRFVDMYNAEMMPLPKVGEKEAFAPDLKNISMKEWQVIRAHYLALVSHVDDCVGKITATLESEGIFDNTIVIFTSDHGEFLGDHGKVQKDMPGHDCITRVPFIMTYPQKINPGTVVDEIVEAVDVVPTILDYCGIQTPTAVQGKSFKNLLEGKIKSHREDAFTEYFEPYGSRKAVVRTAEYKYYCDSEGLEILYDLVNDPDELNNIVHNSLYRDVLCDMRKRMIIRMHKAVFNCHERPAEY